MEILKIETAPGVITQTYWHKGGDKLVVWHHGTPAPRPMSPQMLEVFTRHGFSVAAPVRQGYAGSSAVGPRPIKDDVPVTKKVVEHLSFDEFRTIGYSGGGPRALADLALLENCVAGIAFAPMVPTTLDDFDPFVNAPEEEKKVFDIVRNWEPDLKDRFLKWQEEYLAQDPYADFKDADEDTKAWLQTADAQFRLAQRAIAFESGVDGWMLDEYSMLTPWNFDVENINKPLLILSGDKDTAVDVSCSHWLNKQVKNSELRIYQGFGHSRIFAIDVIDEALNSF
ncbi:MAG: hypothetical protein RIQ88_948 [Actinomycetota bacterium]